MNSINRLFIPFLMVLLLFVGISPSAAKQAGSINVQCPGDLNGDAIPDPFFFKGNGEPNPSKPNPDFDPNVTCMHLGAGDGFVTMADGRVQYIFSFTDLTGTPEQDAMENGMLAAAFPAPLITLNEGEKFYLTMTNVGMMIRPDLFDPHTVHYHGFPQAASVFDGVPDASISINMGASLTYYYKQVEPGTYMYHCHVEATEHMQMGMLGNLYVRAGQSRLPNNINLDGYVHSNSGDADAFPYGDWPNGVDDVDLDGDGIFDEGVHDNYAYNDGDGSTRYDVEKAIQVGSFDPDFHDASWFVQPLPFALMQDKYPMLNGRGYPDTVNPNALSPPAENGGVLSQVEDSLIVANQGDRILLRLSNLNVTRFYTVATLGIPMTVIGHDARELRSADGTEPLHYQTNSLTFGGGMAYDVILDTAGAAPGTYFLYTTNLNYLSNNEEDFGGMMTEIVINP